MSSIRREVLMDVAPAKQDLTIRWLDHAGDHLDRGGFARAVGAEIAEDLPFSQGEADVLHRRDGAVALGDIADIEHGSRLGRNGLSIERVNGNALPLCSTLVTYPSRAFFAYLDLEDLHELRKALAYRGHHPESLEPRVLFWLRNHGSDGPSERHRLPGVATPGARWSCLVEMGVRGSGLERPAARPALLLSLIHISEPT